MAAYLAQGKTMIPLCNNRSDHVSVSITTSSHFYIFISTCLKYRRYNIINNPALEFSKVYFVTFDGVMLAGT